MSRLLLTAVAALALSTAAPAAAEWRRAESPRFIVYSEGSERSLRDYVQKLEIYDWLLRDRFDIEANDWDRKLPIYLVDRDGLEEVRPDIPEQVAGVYLPTGKDIFAIALRGRENEFILLHEYFHHLSIQTGATASWPGWLIEGLAEYYMTAEIADDHVRIGDFNEDRAYLLGFDWIPLEELLTRRPLEVRRSSHAFTYYPVSWLLTHWFLSDPERARQLRTFVAAVSYGTAPVEAMEMATGMTLDDLTRTLKAYVRTRLMVTDYSFPARSVNITVTTLPRVEGDLLLLAQRVKVGVAEARTERSLAEIRRRAGRHPDDPFAIKLLGHAEAHSGDVEKGRTLLERYLEMRPDDVEAGQWLAAMHMTRAAEGEPETAPGEIRAARSLLARAYELEPENYYTLLLLARSREGASNYPTENDLETWRQAYTLAPQLAAIRLGRGTALMRADRGPEAIALLAPLANSPHADQTAAAARVLIEQAMAGQAPLEAAAAAETEEPPEAEPDGRPSAAPPSGEAEDEDPPQD